MIEIPERARPDVVARAPSPVDRPDAFDGSSRGPSGGARRGGGEALRRAGRSLSIVALSVGLVACGNKGDLYLPGSIEDETRVRLLESDGAIDDGTGAADPTTGPAAGPLVAPDGARPIDEADPDEADPDEASRRRTGADPATDPAAGGGS